MKPYYLFAIGPMSSALQSVSAKYYNIKTARVNVFCNTLFKAIGAALFFLVLNSFKMSYNPVTLLCGIGFGVCYALCTMFDLMALKIGPVSLTAMFLNFSLVMPVLFGIFFYKEYPSYLFYIAFVILMASILLITLKKSDGETKEASVNPKWFLYATLALLLNGGCCTIQTFHQRYWQGKGMEGHCKSEFMLYAMIFVILFCAVGTFITMNKGWERKERIDTVKNSAIYGGVTGLLNGALNLCTMIAVLHFDAKIVFPIMCGGALIVTILMSLILFKEKMTVKQWIGVGLGAVAIVLLNM